MATPSLAAVDSLGQITDQGNAITLRSAIIAANANGDSSTDTIHLLAVTYTFSMSGGIGGSGTGEGFTGDALIGDLDITSGNLIVAGAGMNATTIQQTTPTLATPSNDRVFEINPGAVAGPFEVGFQDLAITGGKTPDGGGAIASRAAGNVLNINRVSFDSNTAIAGRGGALFVDGGGDLNVTGSIFTGNTSEIVGGVPSPWTVAQMAPTCKCPGPRSSATTERRTVGALELSSAFSNTSNITTSNFENNQTLGTGSTGGRSISPEPAPSRSRFSATTLLATALPTAPAFTMPAMSISRSTPTTTGGEQALGLPAALSLTNRAARSRSKPGFSFASALIRRRFSLAVPPR